MRSQNKSKRNVKHKNLKVKWMNLSRVDSILFLNVYPHILVNNLNRTTNLSRHQLSSTSTIQTMRHNQVQRSNSILTSQLQVKQINHQVHSILMICLVLITRVNLPPRLFSKCWAKIYLVLTLLQSSLSTKLIKICNKSNHLTLFHQHRVNLFRHHSNSNQSKHRNY